MTEINSFPINTLTFEELDLITDAQATDSDGVLFFDESVGVMKRMTRGELFKGKVIPINSIADFASLPVETYSDRQQFHLNAFAPDGSSGGGPLMWTPNQPKSLHDGIRYFSPTVPAPADFNNPTDVQNYMDGVGEEFPTADGIFELTLYSIQSSEFPSIDGALVLWDGTSGTMLKNGVVPSLIGIQALQIPNIAAVSYARFNADETISMRTLAEHKTDLLLNNVNNTSDADKPISTATQEELDLKANSTAVAAALALKAPLASPSFTGDPVAPTPPPGNSGSSIATTAFVQGELSEFSDRVQSVSTVADLAGVTTDAEDKDFIVTEYATGYTTGGGEFFYDFSDTTTANNNVSVFVFSGKRFKRKNQNLSPLDAGARGDGTTNDDAAFTTFEAVVSNRDVDLLGRTYEVTEIPTLNSYYNGKWALPDRTVMARFDDTISFPGVRCTKFGGQLAQLKNSLCDPFEQFTGIAFLGDSITWGATLPENLSPGSDLTTLATRRDLFASPSFVNEFKRWVGRNYFDDATPVITNWAASSAGEAIATYSKTEQVYTNREPFTWTPTGTSTVTDTAAASAITGYQAVYAVGAGSGNEALIEFPFTGQELTVVFTCVDSDAVDYELIVDGVSQGLFGTSSADGYTNMAFNQRSPHTFGYVRNKTIGIKIVGDGAPSIRRLRIEGIEIPKTVRITNQGISGSNSTRYRSRALTTDFLPDIAVSPEDNFSFLMLGTNDRLDPTWPQGINSFQEQMEDILNILDPLCETIVMCANAVGASNQAGKKFTMQQIRSVLYKMSNIRQHDFVDNYAIFDNADTTRYLADALHPNVLGHYMIYRNIVDSLES